MNIIWFIIDSVNEDFIRHFLNKLTGVYAVFVDKGSTPLMKRAWEVFKTNDFPQYKEIIKIASD